MTKKTFDYFCDRCRCSLTKSTGSTAWTYSIFNLDKLCPDCRKKEREHPDYNYAKEVEFAEVKKGNMNFEGIGKPADL